MVKLVGVLEKRRDFSYMEKLDEKLLNQLIVNAIKDVLRRIEYNIFKNSISINVKNLLVWFKNNTGMGDLKGDYAPQHELCLFCSNGDKKLKMGRHSNILKYARTNNELHST